jgi:tetratricopeptide (TPR) repeat protein
VVRLLARADSAYERGDDAAADSAYATVVALDDRYSYALLRLVRLRGARPADAETLLRRYVALEPEDEEARAWLAAAVAGVDRRAAPGAAAEPRSERARGAQVGRARALAGAGRTQEAIAAYEGWLATNRDDPQAWRELARELQRAGRPRAAGEALARAAAAPGAADDGPTRRLLRQARLAAAPTVDVSAETGTDSDGNRTARREAALGLAWRDGWRVRVVAGRSGVGDGTPGVRRRSATDVALGAEWRPRPALAVDAAVGAASVADTARGGVAAVVPTGEGRVTWRAPGGATRVTARAGRARLTATPRLVGGRVVRDQAALAVDQAVAGPLRARASAQVADFVAPGERNRRLAAGGALALAALPGVELSAGVQGVGFARRSRAGYFAPREARLAELGAALELPLPRGLGVSAELGGGVQRVRPFNAEATPWQPVLRGTAVLTVPLRPGRSLAVGVDAYDARVGGDDAPGGRWRSAVWSARVRSALP